MRLFNAVFLPSFVYEELAVVMEWELLVFGISQPLMHSRICVLFSNQCRVIPDFLMFLLGVGALSVRARLRARLEALSGLMFLPQYQPNNWQTLTTRTSDSCTPPPTATMDS